MLNLSTSFHSTPYTPALQSVSYQHIASTEHLEKYREAQRITHSMGKIFDQLGQVLKVEDSVNSEALPTEDITQSKAWQVLLEELQVLQEMLNKVGDVGQAQYLLQRLQSDQEVMSLLERLSDRKLRALFQKSLQREWERFRLHDKADAYTASLKRQQNESNLPLRSLPKGVDIVEALMHLAEVSQNASGSEHSADLIRLLINTLQDPETQPEQHYSQGLLLGSDANNDG